MKPYIPNPYSILQARISDKGYGLTEEFVEYLDAMKADWYKKHKGNNNEPM